MPIPKPSSGESQDAFVSRCMGNDTMVSDFPDQEQRTAVCFDAWDEAKKISLSQLRKLNPMEWTMRVLQKTLQSAYKGGSKRKKKKGEMSKLLSSWTTVDMFHRHFYFSDTAFTDAPEADPEGHRHEILRDDSGRVTGFAESEGHTHDVVELDDMSMAAPSDKVAVLKFDEEERLVFGVFNVAAVNGQLVKDKHKEHIEPHELEKAMYGFVLNAREAGEEHERTTGVGRLVEAMVFTPEKCAHLEKVLKEEDIPAVVKIDATVAWGGFWIEDDDVWAKIKSGEYAAFSIGGEATREEVEIS